MAVLIDPHPNPAAGAPAARISPGTSLRRRLTGTLALLVVLGLAPATASQAEETRETQKARETQGSKSIDQRIRNLEQELEALREALAALRAEREEKVAEQPEQETGSDAERIAELERRVDLLAAELERLGLGGAAPALVPAVPAEGGEYGLAPAASKVYRTEQGLSIGGYGEMLYESFASERDDGSPADAEDRLDFLRAILYFGYKFNDRILFNSEIEVEHAKSGEEAEGEVALEFGYLDFLLRPEVNVRAGLVLIPMGFLNELHEPPVFLGARRPDVEQRILPSTWRENGFGLFGDLGSWTYRTYVVNGFDATGFSAAGVRGGRQEGSETVAEDFAWVGRLDYTGTPGLLVGGSFYTGNSGQGLSGLDGRELGVGTTLYEGHLEWRYRGFELRALAARSELDDVASLNRVLGLTGADGVGEEQKGYYLQVGYDVFSRSPGRTSSLIPYARYESFDTQAAVAAGFLRDPARDMESLTLGLAYKPMGQVIVKADYQDYDNGAGTALDQFNVAIGYLF
jgi:hypothetical protein